MGNKTLGLYIGRLNPPHIGHIKTIERALVENEKVLILLGTPIMPDEKNPLNFNQRKELLEKKIGDKIVIEEILDSPSDIFWVYNIYKLVYENSFGLRSINFYGGDFKNDSAYLVLNKYEDNILGFNINYIENARKDSFIEFEGKKYELSATNLRNAFKKGNFYLAEKFCDSEMFEDIKLLFN